MHVLFTSMHVSIFLLAHFFQDQCLYSAYGKIVPSYSTAFFCKQNIQHLPKHVLVTSNPTFQYTSNVPMQHKWNSRKWNFNRFKKFHPCLSVQIWIASCTVVYTCTKIDTIRFNRTKYNRWKYRNKNKFFCLVPTFRNTQGRSD